MLHKRKQTINENNNECTHSCVSLDYLVIREMNQLLSQSSLAVMEIKLKKRKKPKMKMLKRILAHHPFYLKGLQGANLRN